MPNIKKAAGQKFDKQVPIRVTEQMKGELYEMAQDTNMSTSDRVRPFLENEIKKWKQQSGRH